MEGKGVVVVAFCLLLVALFFEIFEFGCREEIRCATVIIGESVMVGASFFIMFRQLLGRQDKISSKI